LEAAQIGVPAICAIETTKDQSYGFLQFAPQDSLGDIIADAPRRMITEDILYLASLTTEERLALGKVGRDSARARSESLPQFADRVRAAAPWPIERSMSAVALAASALVLAKLRDRVIKAKGS
jgi:hypothetical protein